MATRIRNETPQQRFKRIAESRTNAVLEKLRLLGNCASRQNYNYTEKDVEQIFSAINRQLKEMKTKFNSRKCEDFKLR